MKLLVEMQKTISRCAACGSLKFVLVYWIARCIWVPESSTFCFEGCPLIVILLYWFFYSPSDKGRAGGYKSQDLTSVVLRIYQVGIVWIQPVLTSGDAKVKASTDVLLHHASCGRRKVNDWIQPPMTCIACWHTPDHYPI